MASLMNFVSGGSLTDLLRNKSYASARAIHTPMRSTTSILTALMTEQIGMCRICLEETDKHKLLRPCKCKGTQAFVHQTCLDMWLKQKHDRTCETCKSDYELEYKGLKPFAQWTWPRPLSDFWEDEADFVCGFLWAIVACRVLYTWFSGGIMDFHNNLMMVFGSRRLVALWWFSFIVNSVYYRQILSQVFHRWLDDNSVYEWKNHFVPENEKELANEAKNSSSFVTALTSMSSVSNVPF